MFYYRIGHNCFGMFRTVHLVEAVGSTFNTLQTIYMRLTDADANVSAVSQKAQEQLDSEEPVVIMDARGQEVVDGPGTQGKSNSDVRFCSNLTTHVLFLTL